MGWVKHLVVLAVGGTLMALAPPTSVAAESNLSVEKYVVSVYDLFLGREPTSVEVDRWANVVASGRRTELTSELAASDEWAGARVNDLYRKILGRDADAGGRAFWVSKIRSGTTLEAVAAGFYGSDEYYRRTGGSPDGFVGRLYTDLLGRPADDDGRIYWVSRLSAGMSRSAVATNFYGSMESRTDRVIGLYGEVLGRAPDDAGMRYWSAQIVALGDVALAAYLAASEEFYVRSTGESPPSTDATVTGRLIDAATGNGIEGYFVAVGDAAQNRHVALSNTTGPDGRYTITGVPVGSHQLFAGTLRQGTPPYLPEYYQDAYQPEHAKTVNLTAGSTSTIDFRLSAGGAIAGSIVSDRTGEPPTGDACVAVSHEDNTFTAFASSQENGEYQVPRLRPGRYFVVVSNCTDRVYEVYDNAPNREQGTLVAVQDLTTTRIDFGITD